MSPELDDVKFKFFGHVIFAALGILGCGIFVLSGSLGAQEIVQAGMMAAGCAGFAALANLALLLCEPVTVTRRHVIAVIVGLGCALAFLFPWMAEPSNGWPTNESVLDAKTNSRVIAPGDAVTFKWYPDNVRSLEGYWRGLPKATILNSKELGCVKELPTKGAIDQKWGIIFSGEVGSTMAPCIEPKLYLPDDDQLVGKTLKIRVTMDVEYPVPVNDYEFDIESKSIAHDETIHIASAQQKQMYSLAWILGATVGFLGTAISGGVILLLAVDLLKNEGFQNALTRRADTDLPPPAVPKTASISEVLKPIDSPNPRRAARQQTVKLGPMQYLQLGAGAVAILIGLPLLINFGCDWKNIALESAVARHGGKTYRAVAETPKHTPVASNHSLFNSSFHPVLFIDLSGSKITDDELQEILQHMTPSVTHIKLDNNRRITNESIERLNDHIQLEFISVRHTGMSPNGVRRLVNFHPGYYPGGASSREVYHNARW